MQKLSLSFLFIGIVGILMAATAFQKSKVDAECVVEAVKTVEKVRKDTVILRDTVYISTAGRRRVSVSSNIPDSINTFHGRNPTGSLDNPCNFKFRYSSDLIYLSGYVNELALNLDSIRVSAPVFSGPDGTIISLSPYVSIESHKYSW